MFYMLEFIDIPGDGIIPTRVVSEYGYNTFGGGFSKCMFAGNVCDLRCEEFASMEEVEAFIEKYKSNRRKFKKAENPPNHYGIEAWKSGGSENAIIKDEIYLVFAYFDGWIPALNYH